MALRNGIRDAISALFVGAAFAKFVAARDCDLVIVGETFEPMDMAMAFPPRYAGRQAGTWTSHTASKSRYFFVVGTTLK